MEGLLLTIYGVLLLAALVFAGIIVYHYHVLKYYRQDFPEEQAQYAIKALWVYLIINGSILIGSIVLALILTLT